MEPVEDEQIKGYGLIFFSLRHTQDNKFSKSA